MFVFSYIAKHICRSYIKCLSVACICMSFVILLCGLRNLIRRQEAELDKIYRTMPIHVEVSDIKGKRDNLFIRDYYIDFFASEKYELAAYLKDICLKRTLIITEFEDNKQLTENEGLDFYLAGITNIKAEEILLAEYDEGIGSEEEFTSEVLLKTSDYCIINETLLQQLGKKPGDTITLTVRSLQNEFNRVDIKDVKTKLIIAGVMEGGDFNKIYCSWNKASLLGSESDQTGTWYTESMSATIRDNKLLNEFKEKAKKYFEYVDITATKAKYALTIYDSIFTKTVFQIQRNIQFLKAIFPVFLFISFGIGLLTSFMITRNRKQELAIMRSMGIGKLKLMALVIIEHCIICLLGIICGSLAVYFMLKSTLKIADIMLFFTSLAIGSVLFAYRIASSIVVKILRVRE